MVVPRIVEFLLLGLPSVPFKMELPFIPPFEVLYNRHYLGPKTATPWPIRFDSGMAIKYWAGKAMPATSSWM